MSVHSTKPSASSASPDRDSTSVVRSDSASFSIRQSERERAVHLARVGRLVKLGINAMKRRALTDAISHFEQAHHIAARFGLGPDVQVGTLRNLAMAKRKAGDEQGAQEAYQQALAVPEITDSQKAAILYGMGLLFHQTGAVQEAQRRLEEAYRLYQNLSAPTERAWAGILLSKVHRELNRIDAAEAVIDQVLKDLSAVEPSERAYAVLEAAQVALSQGDYRRCRAFLQRVSENLSQAEPNLLTEYYLTEARVLYLTGRRDDALSACGQAIDLAIQHQFWVDLREGHELVAALAQPDQ